MQVNANFSIVAAIEANNYHFSPSTQHGVERIMLDRLGEEKARATSIVRYAPQSSFPEHAHPGGEEILVLSGTFSDQSGDYTQGWYLRNPPGSTHTPFSDEGCTIFVKLWQMDAADKQTVRINTNEASSWANEHGRAVCSLFQDQNETTSLQTLLPHENLFTHPRLLVSAELFVFSGSVLYAGTQYTKGSWLRLPKHQDISVLATKQGATVYLKLGEFQNINHKVAV